MEIKNIKGSTFTLVRTKEEVDLIAKEIGELTEDNIALWHHFVEKPKMKHVIDFEMIPHIEFEIAAGCTGEKLSRLHELMIELENMDVIKYYLH